MIAGYVFSRNNNEEFKIENNLPVTDSMLKCYSCKLYSLLKSPIFENLSEVKNESNKKTN